MDVVVPVYGAALELAGCLRSVVQHTDWLRHRLVVVLDGGSIWISRTGISVTRRAVATNPA